MSFVQLILFYCIPEFYHLFNIPLDLGTSCCWKKRKYTSHIDFGSEHASETLQQSTLMPECLHEGLCGMLLEEILLHFYHVPTMVKNCLLLSNILTCI